MAAADEILETALREVRDETTADTTWVVDLDGYEGPLHVLLELARTQKVDLRRISILALAEQYLAYVARLRATRIDLAADYLVMAAWLAYLKSRLLLPRTERSGDEPEPEQLAADLAWRLRRLDAMRAAGRALEELPRAGLDTHVRGAPEDLAVTEIPLWSADLYDLLGAYARQRTRTIETRHTVKPWPVWPIDEARTVLREKLPPQGDWIDLGSLSPASTLFKGEAPSAASRYASLVSASLELAKQGEIDIRQLAMFAPLLVRKTDDRQEQQP
ncbi:MAG: segregation/condensation protein A [Hyphomonadaceae bacterium]|jgi:segregation and condensation protein A|nr:segregation/condensation protein A [Hyphomonadaceae bacterium]